jgi:hypothetical protein
LNLLNKNYEYRKGVWLKTSDLLEELFLMPKLSAILFFYEFVAVVSVFLFDVFYSLFLATTAGSLVTHEPIIYFCYYKIK